MEVYPRMAAILALALFLPRALSQSSAGDGDVTIQATPPVVYTGMTGEVTLNCSFHKTPGSHIDVHMSLLLSKSDINNQMVFETIASLASVTPDKVHVIDALGANVSGHFTADHSYIVYQWPASSVQQEAVYRCEAYGMDKTGHPRSDYDITNITRASLTMEFLSHQLSALQQQNKDLERRLESVVSQLGGHHQSCREKTLEGRISAALNYITEAETTYNGHRYILSRNTLMVHAEGAEKCHLYGGYLAELDDKAEFDAIYQFAKQHNPQSSFVALGGTDYHHEGNWTLEENGKPMNYTNFFPGEPNTVAGEDCLYLSEHYLGLMVNWYCYSMSWMRFLCEIPADTSGCKVTS